MSDYYGRRLFIILPLLGTFLQYLATLIVVQYNLDIKYLFVGFGLAGITGTRCTLSMALSGVVADITKYDKLRSFTFALLHLYDGIGSIIAHISTGYLLKYLGSVPPCLVSLILCFVNLFTCLCLPETLEKSNQRRNNDSLRQKVGRFFAFYTSSSNLRDGEVWQFVMCVLALTLVISPFTTRSSVDTLYFLGRPFCFTSDKIGWYDSADDIVSLCISVFVLKLLHFCANDETIAILSCLSGILSFTVDGFASVWWMLYVAAICGVISLNALPVIRGILSRLVNETRQGALFANLYFLETMFRLIGDLVFFNVYAHTQGFMKGFVYFVYAAFIAVGGAFMIPVLISSRRKFRKMQEMTIQV